MTPLRQRRLDLGLPQAAVAQAAGLSRQALSALEAGRSTPSLPAALALARILGTTVESLFGGTDEDRSRSSYHGTPPPDGRVAWALVGGRLVVRPVPPGVEADALARADPEVGSPRLRQLPGAGDPARNVWLGGCDPALPLVARALGRAAPELRAVALPMTSGEAAAALQRGELHVASLHGAPPEPPLPGAFVFPFASWREGFLLSPAIRPRDLDTTPLRWALRPTGATARRLYQEYAPRRAPALTLTVDGHWAVAQAVRNGDADAGVAIQAAAAAFGLPFVALAQERVELVVHPSAPDVASALGRALSDSRLWAQVLALAGYERLAP